MKKFQGDVKNLIDNVSVPTNRLNNTVNQAIETAKSQKNVRFHKKQKLWASVASMLVLALGSLLLTTHFLGAADKQEQESILYAQGHAGLQRMVEEDRQTNLSLVALDKNIKVTIEEGYLDNSELALSMTINMPQNMNLYSNSNMYEPTLHGELFVNGISRSNFSYSHHSIKHDYTFETIYTLDQTRNIQENDEITIEIDNINGVDGNWRFSFHLEKEEEYIENRDYTTVEDAIGNSFYIGTKRLSPTLLEFTAKTTIVEGEPLEGFSTYEMSVIAIGDDGEMFIQDWYSRGSNQYEAPYHPEEFPFTLGESVKVSRSVDAYTYRVTPYIASYNAREVIIPDGGIGYNWDRIAVPLEKGAIISTESPVEVLAIIQEEEHTIVHITMDPSIPVMPRIAERGSKDHTKAISYKINDNFIEVKYPKLEELKSQEIFMFDATYQVFPELTQKFSLK
ncbi:DUF4179 domain-containing protein [Evansella sp. AB-P1]|uniref:DUF4179 domain-containing protein n=1 Tax=Evansella sp. AB-P1 TaxID=3037653 RepID=UPI00241E728A|nr:DUF4179 domain-containing protein [Evansella sp. AB-P1]MDG5787141.1 DUF4179 domain-containing protein [Evansella sp. AB-P1]